MENEWELYNLQQGHSHNVSTGEVTISANGTLLYIKNTQEDLIFIDDVFISSNGGSLSSRMLVTMIENPTGGDLISDATAVPVTINRDPSSSESLTDNADVYLGKSSGTVTGGEDAEYLYLSENQDREIQIPFVLEQDDCVAFKIEPNLSSGSIKVILDVVIHLDRT